MLALFFEAWGLLGAFGARLDASGARLEASEKRLDRDERIQVVEERKIWRLKEGGGHWRARPRADPGSP